MEKQQREVDENYEAFLALLPGLMKTRAGKFVVLRHKQPIEFFDTAHDALVYAGKTYRDNLFSVQEVTEEVIDLGWFSYM